MAKRLNPEAKQAAQANVLWAALASYAAKRQDRDGLAGGDKHEVALTVAGSIDGAWIEVELVGELLVNHDQQCASSVAPDYARLVAILLEEIPVRRRLRLVSDLPAMLVEAGELPTPSDAETDGIAEQLLKSLRQTKTTTRRGSLRFEPQPALVD